MKKQSIGIVLIECKQEALKEVANQLDEIDIVKDTIRVDGLWRLVAKLEVPNLDNIREYINGKFVKCQALNLL